jgi:hypothetical protein
MIQPLHKIIVGTIKRLPLPAAKFCFRGYNKVLRMLAPEHLAATYFGARIYCNPLYLIQR